MERTPDYIAHLLKDLQGHVDNEELSTRLDEAVDNIWQPKHKPDCQINSDDIWTERVCTCGKG